MLIHENKYNEFIKISLIFLYMTVSMGENTDGNHGTGNN